LRVFVCKLRLHFPDSKHLRGFACHEIFGNIWPTPPQLYMLATALKKTSAPVRLIKRGFQPQNCWYSISTLLNNNATNLEIRGRLYQRRLTR
jgi:hypothetical protein